MFAIAKVVAAKRTFASTYPCLQLQKQSLRSARLHFHIHVCNCKSSRCKAHCKFSFAYPCLQLQKQSLQSARLHPHIDVCNYKRAVCSDQFCSCGFPMVAAADGGQSTPPKFAYALAEAGNLFLQKCYYASLTPVSETSLPLNNHGTRVKNNHTT